MAHDAISNAAQMIPTRTPNALVPHLGLPMGTLVGDAPEIPFPRVGLH